MIVAMLQQSVPLRTNDDGVVLVAGTRVPLDTVVYAYRNGATPEEITESFTSLDLADVHIVIAYVLQHELEVNAYLSQREQLAERVQREVEQRFPATGLREKLTQTARSSRTQSAIRSSPPSPNQPAPRQARA